ncbi:hypothetical protein Tco_0555644 [Tanacetum coccineum]
MISISSRANCASSHTSAHSSLASCSLRSSWCYSKTLLAIMSCEINTPSAFSADGIRIRLVLVVQIRLDRLVKLASHCVSHPAGYPHPNLVLFLPVLEAYSSNIHLAVLERRVIKHLESKS